MGTAPHLGALISALRIRPQRQRIHRLDGLGPCPVDPCAASRPVRSAVAVTVLAAAAVALAFGGGPVDARERPAPCPTDATAPFDDVADDATHAPAIACLYALEITRGVSEHAYGYDRSLAHGQLATFLDRVLATSDQALPVASRPFTDDDGPHAPAIHSLFEVGILTDVDDYDPSASVDRAEMAQVVADGLAWTGVLDEEADEEVFDDVDDVEQADAIHRLGAAGIVRGDGEGSFSPERDVFRGQMATFLANSLTYIDNDGEPLPSPEPAPPEPRTAPEGWLIAGGDGEVIGDAGPLERYTVEIASGLEDQQPLDDFAERVETTLSDPDQGWTSRGDRRLQRVDDPGQADIRVVLGSPDQVDRLCARAGLNTGGIYSCWNGEFAALNGDRWFHGVAHIDDLELYRDYLVNHEVGHGFGFGHVGCPAPGEPAPVMMQQSIRLDGCEPNGVPFP